MPESSRLQEIRRRVRDDEARRYYVIGRFMVPNRAIDDLAHLLDVIDGMEVPALQRLERIELEVRALHAAMEQAVDGENHAYIDGDSVLPSEVLVATAYLARVLEGDL